MSDTSTETEVEDNETPDAAPAAPATRTFKFKSPAVWKLTGTAGSKNLDLIVTFCITVGLGVKRIEPGAYRVWGPLAGITKAVEWIRTFNPAGPLSFEIEQPPDRLKLTFDVTPDREPVRFAEVHGQPDVERLVTRAVDAGLTVQCTGISRFLVTGQTRRHVAWVQETFAVDRARALEIMQLTEAQAAAEDAAAPLPAITVVLPKRETVSDITRDRNGDIVNVTQLERTIQ